MFVLTILVQNPRLYVNIFICDICKNFQYSLRYMLADNTKQLTILNILIIPV